MTDTINNPTKPGYAWLEVDHHVVDAEAGIAALVDVEVPDGIHDPHSRRISSDEKSLRERVARLVDEKRSIEVRLDIDGSDDGLDERLGTVQRGIDKASAELAQLGTEHRAEITRRYESGSAYVEAGVDLSSSVTERADDTRTADVPQFRRAGLDDCMRTLERAPAEQPAPASIADVVRRLQKR